MSKGAHDIKLMIGGISNSIIKESTEPYHIYELWMGEMEKYIKEIMYDKNKYDKDKDDKNKDRYRYSTKIEKETTTGNWWDSKKGNNENINNSEIKIPEKDLQQFKKKNKWLL